jgi:predicted nucleic acid-binding protein
MKKCLIDSNIIIRLIVKDPQDQFLEAKEIIRGIEEEKLQGVLSILVVNEIIWILEHYYDLKRKKFIPILLKLFALKNIKTKEARKDTIISVLQKMQDKKIDFTDVYLKEIAKGIQIFSFDRDFKK